MEPGPNKSRNENTQQGHYITDQEPKYVPIEDYRRLTEDRNWWRNWAQKQQEHNIRSSGDAENLRQRIQRLRKRLEKRADKQLAADQLSGDNHQARMAKLHRNLKSRTRELSDLSEALDKEQRINRDDPAASCKMLVDRIGGILDDIIQQQSLITEVIEHWQDSHEDQNKPDVNIHEQIINLQQEAQQMRSSILAMGKDVSRLQFLSKGTENGPTVFSAEPSELDIYDCLDKLNAPDDCWEDINDGYKLEALRMLIDDAKKESS